MKHLVSVITPTYNHERFIGECIESVLAQTYDNWEMIIVDDGSTDRTWEIVQTYAADDARILAFRQENKGIWRLAETYNFALEQSRGELIAVLEGDDVWARSKLAIQVPAHISGGYAISFGQTQFINASGAIFGRGYPDPRQFPFLHKEDSDGLFRHLLYGEYFLPALTVVITRKCLADLGGFQQPNYLSVVDYPTWLTVGKADGGIGFVHAVLGSWRLHSTQATWLLARDIARGVYRFAVEFAERERLDLNISDDDLGQHLLSQRRRNYLADASYRAAAVSFERGDGKHAWRYCFETVQLGNYRLFTKCLLMFVWKFGRRMANSISHSWVLVVCTLGKGGRTWR
jgi:glycosyltransferase involved in cell wall biosynthesis